ncbi:hypothetical protein, partial [Allomesorhizobium camelthorni]|uniref:hypothetical protein n=1 Tax=Allomesorhizobium camelthorni TaxID=475069 RepID=UPI00197DC1DF
ANPEPSGDEANWGPRIRFSKFARRHDISAKPAAVSGISYFAHRGAGMLYNAEGQARSTGLHTAHFMADTND